ncbi:MAG: hypothetical protein IJU71_06075, partial [Selenomonadaceae bacterium]|nr:hypothetical protein [Selenomonadaceae bacterium]
MLSLDRSTETSTINMLNNAVRSASNNQYSNIQDVIDDMVDDCQTYNANDSVNGWKKFLLEKCDIDLYNGDTGAISGLDAGGSNVEKTAKSIVSENTALDTSFSADSFDVNGLTVRLGKYNQASKTYSDVAFDDLNENEQKIWQGLYSGWIENALALIAESYGDNYGFGSNSLLAENTLYVTFENNSADSALAGVSAPIENADGTLEPLRLKINMAHYNEFMTGDESDGYQMTDNLIGNCYYLERIISHELTHAVMNANVRNATGTNGLPQFIKEGTAELTHGADDHRDVDISSYAQNPSTLRKALNVSTTNNNFCSYAGGYMFMRYIAKQFSSQANTNNHGITSDNYIPTGIVIENNQLTVTESFIGNMIVVSDYDTDVNRVNATALTQKAAILGGTLNDSILGGSNADKLYGGAGADTLRGNGGNDTLFGNEGNDKLYGGAGNDILCGESGNDTLNGGNGADIFVYANGRDVITDYVEGVDKIQLEERSIVSSTLNGSDVIIYTDGNGSLTVKDAKDKFIAIIDRDGNETSAIYGRAPVDGDNWSEFEGLTLNKAKTKLIVETPFTGTIDADNISEKLKLIDASGDNNAVNLIGNAKNNVLKAGAGGSTLNGGGKNDKLYGGDGADVFVFDGQGKDKIYNYAEDDRIVLTDEVTKVKVSGKKAVLTTSSKGTLTINNVSGMTIEITTVDGETSSYSFSKKNKQLSDALIGNEQLASDAYWFEPNVEDDPLESIIPIDNTSVDLEESFELKNLLKQNEITCSARSRHQK